MFKEVKFIKSLSDGKLIPDHRLPEIALCGRSNVGKSSLINSICGRKSLAKTSSSPGKTRLINYYLVENKFFLVDFPGAGYARIGKNERQKWEKMINDFFRTHGNLRLVYHIIDCRHLGINTDLMLAEYLRSFDVKRAVILNKIDKLNLGQIKESVRNVKLIYPEFGEEDIFIYSSLSGSGRVELHKHLKSVISG